MTYTSGVRLIEMANGQGVVSDEQFLDITPAIVGTGEALLEAHSHLGDESLTEFDRWMLIVLRGLTSMESAAGAAWARRDEIEAFDALTNGG